MTKASKEQDHPFGQAARARAITSYLDDFAPTVADDLWKTIYGLLLWIDPTTGLAHCYESDKSQPGRHWYPRTMAFHKWVADEFAVRPRELHHTIDYMFKHCLRIWAVDESAKFGKQKLRAEAQYAAHKEHDLPEPGDNPEFEAQVQALVLEQTGFEVPTNALRVITGEVLERFRRENKRKNLLGEGFEDTLSAILRHAARGSPNVQIHARRALSDLPGFRTSAKGAKASKVDLTIVKPAVEPNQPGTSTKPRTLMAAKWSIRADREEQFRVAYDVYSDSESSGEEFDFALISNEFDAARLLAACNRKRHAKAMFSYVVHICPQALSVVHAKNERSWPELRAHIEAGRLIGLKEWFERLGFVLPSASDPSHSASEPVPAPIEA